MVTNHRVFSAFDNTDWNLGASLPTLDIVVPAGATMKRFQVHSQIIAGTTNGLNLGAVGNFNLIQTVDIVAGQYATRTLFRARRVIRDQVVALYDVVVANRVYSQLINCGDNDLEINQRCSYGLRGGAAFTVRYRGSVTGGLGFGGAISNRTASAVFEIFYETLP